MGGGVKYKCQPTTRVVENKEAQGRGQQQYRRQRGPSNSTRPCPQARIYVYKRLSEAASFTVYSARKRLGVITCILRLERNISGYVCYRMGVSAPLWQSVNDGTALGGHSEVCSGSDGYDHRKRPFKTAYKTETFQSFTKLSLNDAFSSNTTRPLGCRTIYHRPE